MKLVERHLMTRNHLGKYSNEQICKSANLQMKKSICKFAHLHICIFYLYPEIDDLCFRSKNLYNLGTYHQRQEFFQTGGVFSYEPLDKPLQDTDAYCALPAKVSQHVLIQVGKSWESFFAARAAYQENPERFYALPSLPGYKPKLSGRNLLIYTAQAISRPALREGFVVPSKTDIHIKTKPQKVNQVRIVPRVNHYNVQMGKWANGQMKENLQICRFADFVVEVVSEREARDLGMDKNHIAGIEIGVDNLAAVTSNTHGRNLQICKFADLQISSLLINGRPLKSINSYYNQKKAKLQSTLDSSQKTSSSLQDLIIICTMPARRSFHAW